MSTEQFNQEHSPTIDPQTEEAILSFVELNNEIPVKASASKPHRIRKRTRNLIITSVVSVLLAVVLLVVTLTDQQQPPQTDNGTTTPTDTSVETPQITLLDKSKNTQLNQVDIQNDNGIFSIKYSADAHAYRLANYEDISLATDMVVTLRKYTETIVATEQVKDATDLSAYGLEKPAASATIHYADGTNTKLYVGDQTPSKTGYYGQVEGHEGVYIFESDSVALFRFRATAFADTTLVAPPSVKKDDTDGVAIIKELTYSGKKYPTPLMIRRSYQTDPEELTYFSYLISSPYLRCTADKVGTALGSLTAISAKQALILHPTEEEKKALGFDTPSFKLDMTLAVETADDSSTDDEEESPSVYYNTLHYHLTIGNTNDSGDYYVMSDDIDAIFLVDHTAYDAVLNRTYENTVNEYLFYKNITQLSRLSVNLGDHQYDFALKHYPEKEQSDEKMIVTHNGKVHSTEDFRELYQLLMGLERYGTVGDNQAGSAAIAVSLYDLDNNLYLSAEYYYASGSLCIVKTSEGEIFTTRRSDVTFFIQQIENYIAQKDVLLRT